ncbi:MAG TPA: hypothetical protein VGM51_14955 [Armatimonadota bacterium]
MHALYPPRAASARGLTLLLVCCAPLPCALADESRIDVTRVSPAAGNVLIADGGCRYYVEFTAYDENGNEASQVQINFQMTCSPSGNASLSATSGITNIEGKAGVFITGSGHCTGQVRAYIGGYEVCSGWTSFTFVTGHWNPVTVNGVTSDGDPTITHATGTGSGSFAVTGPYSADLGPVAWYEFNFDSRVSSSGSPSSGGAGGDIDIAGKGVNDAYAECETRMTQVYGTTKTAIADATSHLGDTFSISWVKDDLSYSGAPLGNTLNVDICRYSYASHNNTSGGAQAIAGITPLSTLTAAASGTGEVTVNYYDGTLPTGYTNPVTRTGTLGGSTISYIADLYTTITSSSYPDPSVTSNSGYAKGNNTADARFVHSHVNP